MRRQYLTEPGPGVAEVAGRLSGVQAQVASSAATALAIRLGRPAVEEVREALQQERTLVKLWTARGTLHLVPPELAARFCAVLASLGMYERPGWLRNMGISRDELEAILDGVATLLPGRMLSRQELVDALVQHAGTPHLEKALRSGWGSLLKPATYAGLLCHGPADGTRVTFTAPSTWLPGWRLPDPDDAGRRLVLDYLGAYGPAGHDDFANWLYRNVKPAQTKRWFADLAGELVEVDVDGRPALLPAPLLDELAATEPATGVRLLGPFDQYVIAVSRELIPADNLAKVSRTAGWISPVVLHEGRIAGVWTNDPFETDLFETVPRRGLAAAHARFIEQTVPG